MGAHEETYLSTIDKKSSYENKQVRFYIVSLITAYYEFDPNLLYFI